MAFYCRLILMIIVRMRKGEPMSDLIDNGGYRFWDDDFSIQSAYEDCKAVFDGITDDDAFQECDTGIILYHAHEIMYALKKALPSAQPNACKNTCEIERKSNDMISRQAAIDALDKRFDNVPMKLTTEILQLRRDLRERIPSAEPKTGWIPVSERLPKTGDSVLVTYSDGEVGIIWSARPKAWVKYIESNNLIYPIAWMPLPKPYREDGGGE